MLRDHKNLEDRKRKNGRKREASGNSKSCSSQGMWLWLSTQTVVWKVTGRQSSAHCRQRQWDIWPFSVFANEPAAEEQWERSTWSNWPWGLLGKYWWCWHSGFLRLSVASLDWGIVLIATDNPVISCCGNEETASGVKPWLTAWLRKGQLFHSLTSVSSRSTRNSIYNKDRQAPFSMLFSPNSLYFLYFK